MYSYVFFKKEISMRFSVLTEELLLFFRFVYKINVYGKNLLLNSVEFSKNKYEQDRARINMEFQRAFTVI